MEQRLRALEQLVRGEAGGSPGLDGLLDLLLGVHQELSSAPLRRERNVAQFLSWASPFVTKVKELRLQRDDFEILKVIGRGAFGETRPCFIPSGFRGEAEGQWPDLCHEDAA